MSARRWLGSIAAAACLLASAAPADAAITVGPDTSYSGPLGGVGCGSGCTRAGVGSPWTIPSSGVLVRWRIRTGSASANWRIRTVSPLGPSGEATGTSTGPHQAVEPGGERIFEARIPVRAGDQLAIDAPPSATISGYLSSGIASRSWSPPLADGEVPRAANGLTGGLTLLYNADIEPDGDSDGFGDETQDRCPAQAATQGPCVPETTLTKGPKKRIHKSKAKFKFVSDQAGASFECRLDKKKWQPCESPTKVKGLDAGKHKFRVRALNEGVLDPVPAKRKFRVVRG